MTAARVAALKVLSFFSFMPEQPSLLEHLSFSASAAIGDPLRMTAWETVVPAAKTPASAAAHQDIGGFYEFFESILWFVIPWQPRGSAL